jgi:glutathione S-transferase
VGERATYADLSFVPWIELVESVLFLEWDYKSEFPVFAAWYQRLMDRAAVKKVYSMGIFQEQEGRQEANEGRKWL